MQAVICFKLSKGLSQPYWKGHHVLPPSSLTNYAETQPEKGLISGWQDKTFIFQIILVSQTKAKILSVLSIAWVERERTHDRVFPWPPNPKQHWGRVTSCFFCAFSLSHHLPERVKKRKNEHYHQILSILWTLFFWPFHCGLFSALHGSPPWIRLALLARSLTPQLEFACGGFIRSWYNAGTAPY